MFLGFGSIVSGYLICTGMIFNVVFNVVLFVRIISFGQAWQVSQYSVLEMAVHMLLWFNLI